MLKNKKGITLIEIIIVIAISSIVLFSLFSVFAFGNNTNNKGNSQYYVQSDVRLVSDYIQRQIRYATNVEIMNNKPTTEGAFDYIYFDSTNRRIIHNIYKEDGNREMSLHGETLTSMYFSNNENDNTITLHVIGRNDEDHLNTDSIYRLDSELVLPNIYIDGSIISGGAIESIGNEYTNVIKFTKSIDAIGEESVTNPDDEPESTSIKPLSIVSTSKKSFTLTFNHDIKSDGTIELRNSSDVDILEKNNIDINNESSDPVLIIKDLKTNTSDYYTLIVDLKYDEESSETIVLELYFNNSDSPNWRSISYTIDGKTKDWVNP